MYRYAWARSTASALLAVACAAGALAAQAEGQAETEPPDPPPNGTQMVFVNTQAILPQVPGAREAQETWQQELQEYNVEVQRLRAEVDSLLASYRQQETMLSSQAKDERQRQIVDKQQQLQQRASELEQKAGQRQQELLKPILDRVGDVIEQVRQERDYTIVFDIAGSGVVAADPSLDITSLVLDKIQAGGSAASAATPSR